MLVGLSVLHGLDSQNISVKFRDLVPVLGMMTRINPAIVYVFYHIFIQENAFFLSENENGYQYAIMGLFYYFCVIDPSPKSYLFTEKSKEKTD